jgi:glutathione synthase/RimK-type ligase-like ATP-grasp enzyme
MLEHPMILLVSHPKDPTTQAISASLERKAQPCVWFDFNSFPQQDSITFRANSEGHLSHSYQIQGRSINLDQVTAVLWRRPSKPVAPQTVTDAEVKSYIEATSSEVLAGLFEDLNCFQVPASRQILGAAHSKIIQLSLAVKTGFSIPKTLITNDSKELLDFYHQNEGRIITKTASVTAAQVVRGCVNGYTKLMRPRDLTYFQDIRLCPFIAQAYVEKAFELRVTVVGSDVFSAEIHSQVTNRTRVDWRRYDHRKTPYFSHVLPASIADKCLRLTQSMNLAYSAIDMVRTPEGEYVFLELNPNGQYHWIEQFTGLPITERLSMLLINHR